MEWTAGNLKSNWKKSQSCTCLTLSFCTSRNKRKDAYPHIHTHTPDTQTCMHARVCTHTHTHIHKHTLIYKHACTHTDTHTHTAYILSHTTHDISSFITLCFSKKSPPPHHISQKLPIKHQITGNLAIWKPINIIHFAISGKIQPVQGSQRRRGGRKAGQKGDSRASTLGSPTTHD